MASYRSGMLWAIMFLAIHGGCADSDTIKKACSGAKYVDFCISSLSKAPGALQADLTKLTVIAVDLPSDEVKKVSSVIENLKKQNPSASALNDCSELFGDASDQLQNSQAKLKQLSNANFNGNVADVQTWLSGVVSSQDTCVTGLEETNAPPTLISTVKQNTDNFSKLISDALAVLNKLKEQGHI